MREEEEEEVEEEEVEEVEEEEEEEMCVGFPDLPQDEEGGKVCCSYCRPLCQLL